MRWLIISDIHDRIRRANQIIEREPHDRLLLLGDFFDSFLTGVPAAADTARQVKRWLHSPNTICLLGNHDMSYGWGQQNPRYLCAGYSPAKWTTINAILTSEDWQKFKLHAWLEGAEGPWLMTHAGIHQAWLETVEAVNYRDFIDQSCTYAWERLIRGEYHFLLGCGQCRGGDQNAGGITWMDWGELTPISGLNQLIGHTPRVLVRHKNTPRSRNICLDTSLRHYAVFESGQIEIKNWADLPPARVK